MNEMASDAPRHLDGRSEQVQFTYAHDGQPWLRRQVIRTVEAASGSGHFRRLYDDWVASGAAGNPFDAALERLRLRPDLGGTPLADIPQTGGLLLVANHPFGIADGLALGWLATQLRRETRILSLALICTGPEVRAFLLPGDVGETAQARSVSVETRRVAADVLANGGAGVIFPGGSVATSNRPLRSPAAELPWHPFVARLARVAGTTTLPVHIHGQNSHLFQLASHVSYPLRVALLFHETRRRMGGNVAMTVGAPLSSQDVGALPRRDIADALRARCLAAGNVRSTEAFAWPRHIRW